MNSSIINTRYLLAFGETGKIKFENGIENNEMYDNWKKKYHATSNKHDGRQEIYYF